MDSEAINAATQVSVQGPRPKPQGSSAGRVEAVPPPSPQSEDTVSLSDEGKQAVAQSPEPQQTQTQGSQNKQRQFDVGEDNQLVLKIVDGTTGRVVKQIPAEEEIRLRQAIQDGIESSDI